MMNQFALRCCAFLLFFTACFSPEFDDGKISCGPNDMCPPGLTCIGGLCRTHDPGNVDAPSNGFAVTITAGGNGTGTVNSSPAGINCGSDCTENFPAGTMVTLTASPNATSQFVGWSGDCSGTGTCVVTVNSAVNVTANFALNNSLVVTPAGNGAGTVTSNPGGINCGSDCSEAYTPGTMVVLTAAPATGSYFDGWTGGGCSGLGTCTVTLDAAKMVTATFTLTRLTLTVANSGNGAGNVASTPTGIDCGADCTEAYDYGTTVTLTATPAVGSTFAGWSGGGCSGTSTCMVTMSAAASVTATFTLLRYDLTVAKAGNGAGTVTSAPAGVNCGGTCTAQFDYNTSVTLSATPTAGSVFTGWSGGGCSGTASCIVTITAAASVTATFTLTTPSLTAAKAGNGSGTVTSNPAGISCGIDCAQAYNYGSTITLTAAADVGSTFTGWSGGGCSGTGSCTVTLIGATTVTATFTLTQHTLTVSTNGTGSGTISGVGINCGADCTEPFDYGTTVVLTASPAAGSTFTGWSGGGCSGTGTCTVTMTTATSVFATFTVNTYQLTVQKAGNGSGTVTSSPIGISCGADCAEIFNYGTSVTLTAAPATGSTFSGWSGGGCSGTGTCTTTISAAATVTATFTLTTQLLTVTTSGSTGSGTITSNPSGINCGADCTEPYNYGTSVTLTATPAGGSVFNGWSGGGCSGTVLTCTVVLTAATTVTANFIPGTNSMTVNVAGNGSGSVLSNPAGISCGADCTENFTNGTSVTLSAAPVTGSVFTGWSGGGCTGTGTCTITISAAVTVTATFTLSTHQLTTSKAGNGGGTVSSSDGLINCGVDCGELYNYGTTITLTATPTTGSSFTGWSGGGCSGTGTCTVTMAAATNVTATFNLNQYLLTVSDTGNGSGTVTSAPAGINCGVDCTELYNYGTAVTLTATPATGSTFTGWSGACSGTGTCTVTIAAAASVFANFTLNRYTLAVTLGGPASAGTVTSSPAGINCGVTCSALFDYNTSVTLTATPAAGYTFTGWSGAGCTGTGTCSITMTSATAVTANFVLTTYVLTANLAGNGAGSISSSPAGISCGTSGTPDCTEAYASGTTVTLTAAAGTGTTFTGWSGACSGTGACTLTMNAAKSVTATFTLNKVRLTITKSGSGSGTVVSNPAGVSCGPTCFFDFDYGTSVNIIATATFGSSFGTYTGGGCGASSTCTITMTAATSVDTRFNLNPPNYAFVSSTTVALASLSGSGGGNPLIGADSFCQNRAAAAGLTGTYKAWISTTTTNAKDRFVNVSGWRRPGDNKPILVNLSDLTLQKMYYPINRDEFGNAVNDGAVVATATGADGRLFSGGTCGDWSNNFGSTAGGIPYYDSSWFSQYTSVSCGASTHLYCFGADYQAVVAPAAPPAGFRRAFLSTPWSPGGGISSADAKCASDATAAGLPGTYHALLATTTASAISRFNTALGPWARPDGVLITATAATLANAAITFIDAPPNQTADGANYMTYPPIPWTGASTLTSAGTATSTCQNWTSNSSLDRGYGGSTSSTNIASWLFSFSIQCDTTNPSTALTCLQD